MLVIQRLGHGIPVAAQRNLQQVEQLLGVQAPRGMRTAAMHQDTHAVCCQALGRQQEPGQVTFLARVAWPVEVDLHWRRLQALAQGFGEACQFLGALFLVPQQHQERTQLGFFDLLVEQHAHGLTGFFAGQAASAALAFAKDAHKLGERVLSRGFEG